MAHESISTLLDLSDRTIIVTGASGHIGGAIARTLADAGAKLALQYHHNADAVNSLVKESNAIDGQLLPVQADLSDPEQPQRIVDKAIAEFGSLYGLVNNAGIQPVTPFDNITTPDFAQMMATNATGPFSLIQCCARLWSQTPDMHAVVNIASIEGQQPAIGHSHYATSKAALIMLTKAAAIELGRHDIRVNAISPGLINRDGLREAWSDGVTRWENAAPLQRMGTPDDVARATLFLMSDAAQWITGANLDVDGGMLARPMW
ncbi:MAG: SDR family oxidoreductase [Alphaproteobacteria bacterium]|nr:SDR family oxidoreductase [Alphaproteobacteria bacterium]